jgi:hypothetical protein
MQFIYRFRIPALFCALAVLVCELVSRPFVNMGICDDWPYILMTQKLAATGHVVYNGWAAPMLTWQLYLGAALIKLFGFSFTVVRMSTVLVAMALAFVLQRTMVRANISERNATIGTLTLVLSPIFLMLSATFMTDIHGLFAIILCLYGCLRALQSHTSRAMIGWLCFAIIANAICGTSRQIAWLGILVMVPSTLWLLRAQRRVLVAGAASTFTGVLFIFACLQWLKQQPYSIPEHLLPETLPLVNTFRQLFHTFLDVPFLLLPVMALFLSAIRKSHRRVVAILSAIGLLYAFLTIRDRDLKPNFMLMPTHGDWVGVHGIYESMYLQGIPPIFIHSRVAILLTMASIGGLLGLIAAMFPRRPEVPAATLCPSISWKQLAILLAPFTLAYGLLLVPRAASGGLFDRYLLPLLAIILLCLVRFYQDRIHPQLPLAGLLLVGVMAVYGVAVTHNTFALYRAREALATELVAAGVPDTSVDNGWEYNMGVELHHTASINFPTIVIPPNAYVQTPPPPPGICQAWWYDYTPHIHPLYGVSFDPNACYGPAPFAPVTYSRWLAYGPGTLYVVRYTVSSKP